MSDLTRLNPTPHAIAVYASQPLSPVATQHSLPSRTLPFTWAGLSPAGSHQLCLAHSLDHLVGAAEQREREGDAERIGGFEIEHQLDVHRLLHRQVGGLGALEYAADIDASEALRVVDAGAVAHQPAGLRVLADIVDGGYGMLRRQADD